jgi:hypothetical protein
MSISNLPPLYDLDDSHPRAKLSWLRRHTHDPDIGGLESLKHRTRRRLHGARAKILQQQARARSVPGVQRSGKAGGDRSASLVGNERNAFARLNSEASFHGVFCAGHQVGLRQTKCPHAKYFNKFRDDLYWAVNTGPKVWNAVAASAEISRFSEFFEGKSGVLEDSDKQT